MNAELKVRLAKLFKDIDNLVMPGDNYQNYMCESHIEDLQNQARQLELDIESHERRNSQS